MYYKSSCMILLLLLLMSGIVFSFDDKRARINLYSSHISSTNDTYPLKISHVDSFTTGQKNRKLIAINGDIVIDESNLDNINIHRKSTHSRLLQISEKLIPFGRNYFWDTVWPTFDKYKTSTVWNTSSPGRPTFSKAHFVVLPIYWDGDSPDSNFNRETTISMFEEVSEGYRSMSWGKLNVTWEVWDRVVLPGVTRVNANFTNSQEAAIKIVRSKKYYKLKNYTSILLLYSNAEEEPFSGSGGWADVNGNFLWQTFDSGFDVLRHEIGHNFGHPHHLSNDYVWRFERGASEDSYDGFDMMSGGNGYYLSDLAAASKWYYNWIPNNNIVLMQPEGSNSKCLRCVSSVKDLILSPFDDPLLPPSIRTKMAVQIPITGTMDGNTAFSYWLTYRGVSVDGKASGGLSIHVAWFSIYGDTYGASFDSLNYDVFGDTDSKFDSFLVPGTCYVIPPPGRTMDVDPGASKLVQPIVCVTSINKSESITISVSFLNPSTPPKQIITPASSKVLQCSTSGSPSGTMSLDMSSNKFHMLHFNNTGFEGNISLSLCRKSSSSPSIIAYFYDSFPYSSIAFNSPRGYGAYKRLRGATSCPTIARTTYQTQHGEAYVLIARNPSAPSSLSGPVTVQTRCTLKSCGTNNYLGQDGLCKRCPQGMISPASSVSVQACVSCTIDGMIVADPQMNVCMLPLKYNASLTSALEWRLITPAQHTEHKWKLDIEGIRFYSTETCTSNSIIKVDSGVPFDSGNAGSPDYTPNNAFDDSTDSIWGGRTDTRDLFWVGMKFPAVVTIKCIELDLVDNVSDLWVQSRSSRLSAWRNTWIASGLTPGTNTITIKT